MRQICYTSVGTKSITAICTNTQYGQCKYRLVMITHCHGLGIISQRVVSLQYEPALTAHHTRTFYYTRSCPNYNYSCSVQTFHINIVYTCHNTIRKFLKEQQNIHTLSKRLDSLGLDQALIAQYKQKFHFTTAHTNPCIQVSTHPYALCSVPLKVLKEHLFAHIWL